MSSTYLQAALRGQRSILFSAMLILTTMAVVPSAALAQTDPGIPDTVRIDSIRVLLGQQAAVSVDFFNDEPLVAIEVTLTTDFPNLVLDSFSFAGGRVSYIATKGWVHDTTETAMTIYCFPTEEPIIPSGQGLLGHFYVSNPDLTTPRLVTIDTTSIEIDLVFRSTRFSDSTVTSFTPRFRPGYIEYSESCCINNVRGNVNYDVEDQVDISDLTLLVNALFVTPGEVILKCDEEANVNGSADGTIDISDLTYLVNHLFVDPASYPLLPCGL